jgi:hypothetical protein
MFSTSGSEREVILEDTAEQLNDYFSLVIPATGTWIFHSCLFGLPFTVALH